MEQLHIKKEEMFNLMKDLGFSDDIIKTNRIILDRYIEYLIAHSYEINVESALLFCDNYYDIYPKSRNKKYCIVKSRRAIFKFLLFIENGEINSRWVPKPNDLLGTHSHIFTQFLEDENKRLKSSTIREYKSVVNEFNEYLNSNNVLVITYNNIIGYFASFSKDCLHPHAFYHRTTIIKKLLSFLYENKYIDEDLSKIVPKAKYKRPKELPSAYSSEEISKILNSIDRNSKMGKRDYAMICLAVYLGLRAGDIVNLKFENIDWENNQIKIIMNKTNKEISLPLLPEVGNAILDYIKNSRRKCNLKEIFISSNGKYSSVTSNTLYSKVKYYISLSQIDVKCRKCGPHSLRHSLATRMLKKGQPLPVISEALGHSDTQVTTIYTSIDFNSLKDCALEVLPIKSPIYQGGSEHAS